MASKKQIVKPYSKVEIVGYLLTTPLKLKTNRYEQSYASFVISITKDQKITSIPKPRKKPTIVSCFMVGSLAEKFVKEQEVYDLIKLSGRLDNNNFYLPEDDYKHIQGLVMSCDKYKILYRKPTTIITKEKGVM